MTYGVVHLELHTGDQAEAAAFLSQLLGWPSELIGPAGSAYLALSVGDRLGGGIVGCGARPSQWLPYVDVDHLEQVTEHARGLGASVLLEPREGRYGWRSVVTAPASGTIALWQTKSGRHR